MTATGHNLMAAENGQTEAKPWSDYAHSDDDWTIPLGSLASIDRSILGCARFSMVTQAKRVLCAATVSARLSDELKSQDWAGVWGQSPLWRSS